MKKGRAGAPSPNEKAAGNQPGTISAAAAAFRRVSGKFSMGLASHAIERRSLPVGRSDERFRPSVPPMDQAQPPPLRSLACCAYGIRKSARSVTIVSSAGTSAAKSLTNAAHCRCFVASAAKTAANALGTSSGIAVPRRANVAAIAQLKRSASKS